MFIKIPVFFINDDDSDIIPGKDIGVTEGELYVNVSTICAYHSDDNGYTMIRLSNGDVFRSPIEFGAFVKMFPDLLATLEIYTTTEN